MNASPDTLRKFPRSIRQAFPWDDQTNALGIDGPEVPFDPPGLRKLLRALWALLTQPAH